MKLTIDGRAVTLEGPATLLEAARANGIFIPSLCDHPGLDPYAACRICLVEVKGRRGYIPACSTAAEEGMEVVTSTPDLLALRRGILELILAEHPHACLICSEKPSCDDHKSTIRKTGEVTGCVLCPANGRCELQKVVDAMGLSLVPFPSHRRPGEVRRDDPFIDRDNSLCILCGRCVRVCQEVRGASILTFVSRGSATVIGTALDRRLLDSGCQFCGACVDVCPTGSLTERAARYDRPAEHEAKVVCPLCGQGCGLVVKSREGRVQTAAPDPESPVNSGQACVRGRFLVKTAAHHPHRLLRPMVRVDGALRPASWEEALEAAAARLAASPAGPVGVAASADSSCEDLFALHRFAGEALKGGAVAGPWRDAAAARLHGARLSAGWSAPLGFRLADIRGAGAVLVLDENLPLTQPLVNLEVVRALRKGAAVVSAGPAGGSGALEGSSGLVVPAGKAALLVSALTSFFLENADRRAAGLPGFEAFKTSFERFDRAKALRELGLAGERFLDISRRLAGGPPLAILFGTGWLRAAGPEGAEALVNLSLAAGGRLFALDGGANTRGALAIAGAFPPGPAASGAPRVLYVAGPASGPRPAGTECVIYQGSYADELAGSADILLPEATAFEAEGTYVNIEGRIQVSGPAVAPAGEARPGWSIVGGLAAKLGAPGPPDASAAEVRARLARAVPAFRGLDPDGGGTGPAFLEERAGGAESYIVDPRARGDRLPEGPAAPLPPDVYKGLDLALENKSLKLVRGR
jgi:NADH dehydrogenase/NADH:ubiquinone oxidoreductase subunit G